jgi:hypothetical protein
MIPVWACVICGRPYRPHPASVSRCEACTRRAGIKARRDARTVARRHFLGRDGEPAPNEAQMRTAEADAPTAAGQSKPDAHVRRVGGGPLITTKETS